MTGQDEREALEHRYNVTRADGRSAPGEKHNGCRYFVLDLTHDPKANALLDAYFDRPTPHVVETVAELPIAQMYESGQVAMAVADRHGQPWVLWEAERGDVVGRSYLTDDEQYACEDVEGLAWPLTVLAPAPAPFCHFAPYGSTNALCDEIVPRSVAWDASRGEYADARFTTRREDTTCPECQRRMGGTPAPAPADREALMERVARALYGHHMPGDIEFWDSGLPENFKAMYRREARAAIDAIEEVRRG